MHFKPKRVKIQRVFCLGLLLVALPVATGAEVSLSEVYESDDGSLVFRYPAGWVLSDAAFSESSGEIILSSSSTANVESGTVTSMDGVLQVLIGISELPERGAAPMWKGMNPIELATVMFSQLKEELEFGGLITAPTELDFGAAMFAGDISGQVFNVPLEEMISMIFVIQSPDEEHLLGLMAFTALGGMDSFKELVLAMAESIGYAVPTLDPIDEGLLAAVSYGEIDEVRALLDAGANVNVKNEQGDTPLLMTSDLEMVQLLLDRGAEIDIKNYGWTVLMLAANSGETKLVRVLLDAGAEVDARDDVGIMGAHGRTALMLATGRGHTEIVQLLIDAEADVNAKTTQGDWTVLKIAEYERRFEIVELLKAAGARE